MGCSALLAIWHWKIEHVQNLHQLHPKYFLQKVLLFFQHVYLFHICVYLFISYFYNNEYQLHIHYTVSKFPLHPRISCFVKSSNFPTYSLASLVVTQTFPVNPVKHHQRHQKFPPPLRVPQLQIIYDLLCPGFYPPSWYLSSLLLSIRSYNNPLLSFFYPPFITLEYLSYPFKYRFNLTVHYQLLFVFKCE